MVKILPPFVLPMFLTVCSNIFASTNEYLDNKFIYFHELFFCNNSGDSIKTKKLIRYFFPKIKGFFSAVTITSNAFVYVLLLYIFW